MARVLFVCLHNAGRSQMSQALFERAADGRHEARSAGTGAPDRLDPTAPRFGPAPRYRPPALSAATAAGRPLPGLPCLRSLGARFGAHVEIFVGGLDVVVPAGIGVAAPHRRDGAYVLGGRCSYPLRTSDPSGVVEVRAGRRLTLGDLFAVWGQPLSRR